MWDSESWTPIGKLQDECGDGTLSLTCSPDGHLIAAIRNTTKVILWDAKTYTLVRSLELAETEPLLSLEFLPNRRLVVTGQYQATQYDLATFEKCDIRSNLGYRTYKSFPGPLQSFYLTGSWMTFFLQRLFWLPPR